MATNKDDTAGLTALEKKLMDHAAVMRKEDAITEKNITMNIEDVLKDNGLEMNIVSKD